MPRPQLAGRLLERGVTRVFATELSAVLRLGRFLGPWADAVTAPAGIARSVLVTRTCGGTRQLQTFLYQPRGAARGTFLVANGLNPFGPLDPRADRFARILAHAGFWVASPALPDYLALRCVPEVATDFAAVFDQLLAHPARPPAPPSLLSISFGSLPLLSLLADPARGPKVGAAIVFGGYADPAATLRYCLGEPAAGSPPADPLNMPAVALNLVDTLPLTAATRARLASAWLDFARATWGKPELQPRARHVPIAEELAQTLPPEERELFLRGAGLAPDSAEFFRAVLAHAAAPMAAIDPRAALANARHAMPVVHLMHGRDDDVIPLRELDALAAAFPAHVRTERYVTGLYGHTQTTGVMRQLPLWFGEGRTFVRMLQAIARTGRGR